MKQKIIDDLEQEPIKKKRVKKNKNFVKGFFHHYEHQTISDTHDCQNENPSIKISNEAIVEWIKVKKR